MSPDSAGLLVAGAIAEARGMPFRLQQQHPVGGGCIHRAVSLEGEGQRYFAKLNDAEHLPMLECEAEGLAAIEATGTLRTPRVVTCGAGSGLAWLALEWLELGPLEPGTGESLGEALAALHALPQERFGWARDNYIGASPQPNGWSDDWLDFWRMRRLMPQLRLAARNRLPSRMIDRGERLAADCEAFFGSYAPRPSLLHGDLWGGNAARVVAGPPVVFDPAVYAGDREADLAMTELFGGFPASFGATYRERLPLDDGYVARRDLYNLYHVLNHANLFAGDYVRDASERIEKLLSEAA